MPMTGGIASQALKRTTRTRNEAPVFVLGCGRSGTTLLYHMILSAGDFVVYRTESNAMNLLEPRFGDLSVSRNKEKLMDAWLNSKLFWVSGLDGDGFIGGTEPRIGGQEQRHEPPLATARPSASR